MSEVLVATSLTKNYDDGRRSLSVLNGVNLTVIRGERICIFGRSGSGKSTLLHILGGLLDADEGEVWLNGECINELSGPERAAIRNRDLGFVYQFHHLLPEFTAIENVAMPLLIGGEKSRVAKEKAHDLLERIGLEARTSHLPKELSGGERLRVAVARAVIGEPKIVLADEPTGSLDAESAHQVLDLIQSVSDLLDTAFILVSHDEASATYAQRSYRLEEGRLHELI